MLSVAWSAFSVGISGAEADDDWDDTDSLLPIDVSSAARLEPSPTADTQTKRNEHYTFLHHVFIYIPLN